MNLKIEVTSTKPVKETLTAIANAAKQWETAELLKSYGDNEHFKMDRPGIAIRFTVLPSEPQLVKLEM